MMRGVSTGLMAALVSTAAAGASELPPPEYNSAVYVWSSRNDFRWDYSFDRDLAASRTSAGGVSSGFAQTGDGYLKASATSTGPGQARYGDATSQFIGYLVPNQDATVTFNLWLDAALEANGRDLLTTLAGNPSAWAVPGSYGDIANVLTGVILTMRLYNIDTRTEQYARFGIQRGYGIEYASIDQPSLLTWSYSSSYFDYVSDTGQRVDTQVGRLPDTSVVIAQNFASRFSLAGGQRHSMILEMNCWSQIDADATIVAAAGYDGSRLNASCNAANSAYWNGMTNIVGPGGQPVSGFSLGMTRDTGNYLYSSPLSPQPLAPGAFLPPSTAVPEPASWAMLIAGFGLTGGLARRRRALA